MKGRSARLPGPLATLREGDTRLIAVVAMVYSASLAMESVAMPLLAIAAGYSRTDVGLLTALSALAQLVSRLGAAPLMRRVPDRVLVSAAGLVITASSALLAWSAAPLVFVVAELLQGLARGMFWTGAQTHVVRSTGRVVGRLAVVNFVSSIGLLAGPPLAGALATSSFELTLLVAAGLSACSVALSFRLARMEPFEAVKGRFGVRAWHHSGVRLGCWAGVSAGSWRGLVSSYLPVILTEASESSVTVGVMVAVANGASIAGSALMGALRGRGARVAFPVGVVLTGAGIGLVGAFPGVPVLVAALLAASGVGAGLLQTLGPAAAATSVAAAERGDAVAIAGSFRAAALFFAPIVTAGLLGVIGLGPAIGLAGGLLALPVVARQKGTARPSVEP